MTIKTGYKQDIKGSYILKDPDSQLVYSMDWGTEWLPEGDALATVSYAVEAITGDTNPLAIESQGIQALEQLTYVELSGGSARNIYTVTVTITTTDSNTDVRRFRIKCEDRFI